MPEEFNNNIDIMGTNSQDNNIKSSGVMGIIKKILYYHPFIFLFLSFILAVIAWSVYPERKDYEKPTAEELYQAGYDHLIRVINPDLPLSKSTIVDEALFARTNLINLLVFYRASLDNYPEFINPHLLLAEANRLLAVYDNVLKNKYYDEAKIAYLDALLWESHKFDEKDEAMYVANNFLDFSIFKNLSNSEIASIKQNIDSDKLEEKKQARNDYINFRLTQCKVELGKYEEAKSDLEAMINKYRTKQREERQDNLAGIYFVDNNKINYFEIKDADYKNLTFLLAKTYDGLSLYEQAKESYITYISNAVEIKNIIYAYERLAKLSQETAILYRRVDQDIARKEFLNAATYFDIISNFQLVNQSERRYALFNSANMYSELAELISDGTKSSFDNIAEYTQNIAEALEGISESSLPERIKVLPEALGDLLLRSGTVFPDFISVSGILVGDVAAISATENDTPYIKKRSILDEAIERYDLVAKEDSHDDLGVKSLLFAARTNLIKGSLVDARNRYKQILNDVNLTEVSLACRLGMAKIDIYNNNLFQAKINLLGGVEYFGSAWLKPSDTNWQRFAQRLGDKEFTSRPGIYRVFNRLISKEGKNIAELANSGRKLSPEYIDRLVRDLNAVLKDQNFYNKEDFIDIIISEPLGYLLSADVEILSDEDIVWRNRMLLEASLPYELINITRYQTKLVEPFPSKKTLEYSDVIKLPDVDNALLALSRSFTKQAIKTNKVSNKIRFLKEAENAYAFAIEKYKDNLGESLSELAEVYEMLADIREKQGLFSDSLSYTALAARTYYKVHLEVGGTSRDYETLLDAGNAFFKAGLFERTIETLNIFLNKYAYTSSSANDASMEVSRTKNLLGRCYWLLGLHDSAIKVFKENLKSRTPEMYKSLYYIGHILMEKAVVDGGDKALLGNIDNPMPRLDKEGDPEIETALQAFNYLRQLQGLSPTSRPWRWATFDLGQLWFYLAVNKRIELSSGSEEDKLKNKETILLYDNMARRTLLESLERYPLVTGSGYGISLRLEPEDYAEVMAARFNNEYFLANILLRMSIDHDNSSYAVITRFHLENLANRNMYSDLLFDNTLNSFQLIPAIISDLLNIKSDVLPQSRLGNYEGPIYSPYLMSLRLRNALYTLAGEFFKAGDFAIKNNDPNTANSFYERSYEAYQAIYDRFGQPDGAQAMLGMAECLNKLGRYNEAASHYSIAENIAKSLPSDLKPDGLLDIGPSFWANRAKERLADQLAGYTVQ